MAEKGLGPNGALRFCMAELRRSSWLREKLQALEDDKDCYPYVVIDCPGQTELYRSPRGYVSDESLRRRDDVDSPWRRVAAAPRRGDSAEASRGGGAATPRPRRG